VFRLWITELRPKWQVQFPSHGCRVCGTGDDEGEPAEECLLLAELRVPLLFSGVWQIAGTVEIDEEQRPCLIHSRLLQEWLFCGCACRSPDSAPVSTPPGLPGYQIVAAGVIRGNGTRRTPSYNNLRGSIFSPSPPEDGKILVTFDGYSRPAQDDSFQYIIKALPIYDDALNDRLKKDVSVALDRYLTDGFVLRVTDGSGLPIKDVTAPQGGPVLSDLQFMIEVSRYQ
jgi:hypothetical protein